MNDSENPNLMGVRILGDVTSHLARGGGSKDALVGVVGALCRGLGNDHCWIWIRTADGTGHEAVCAEGGALPPKGHEELVKGWMERPTVEEDFQGGLVMRIPLVHQGEQLGLLDTTIPQSPHSGMLLPCPLKKPALFRNERFSFDQT